METGWREVHDPVKRALGFWRGLFVSSGSREPVALSIDRDSRLFESGGRAAQSGDELQESVPGGLGRRGQALPAGHVPMAENHRPEDGVMVHAQVVDPGSGNGLCVLGEARYAGTGHLERSAPGA